MGSLFCRVETPLKRLVHPDERLEIRRDGDRIVDPLSRRWPFSPGVHTTQRRFRRG
jgi:hypothetical protein